jgi:hypothetical protein
VPILLFVVLYCRFDLKLKPHCRAFFNRTLCPFVPQFAVYTACPMSLEKMIECPDTLPLLSLRICGLSGTDWGEGVRGGEKENSNNNNSSSNNNNNNNSNNNNNNSNNNNNNNTNSYYTYSGRFAFFVLFCLLFTVWPVCLQCVDAPGNLAVRSPLICTLV